MFIHTKGRGPRPSARAARRQEMTRVQTQSATREPEEDPMREETRSVQREPSVERIPVETPSSSLPRPSSRRSGSINRSSHSRPRYEARPYGSQEHTPPREESHRSQTLPPPCMARGSIHMHPSSSGTPAYLVFDSASVSFNGVFHNDHLYWSSRGCTPFGCHCVHYWQGAAILLGFITCSGESSRAEHLPEPPQSPQ